MIRETFCIELTPVTFEQIQNVFLEGSRAAEKYLLVDDVEKREMLQKLLSNMTIENGNVAQIQFKSPYHLLAQTPKNADFETMLAVLNSNPYLSFDTVSIYGRTQ